MTTDSFLSACGTSAPLSVVIEGPGFPAAELRSFSGPFGLIGRDERADLVLDHDAISRRHVYLQLIGGRLYFVDLDSRNGISVGETPTESGWLGPDDVLVLGPFTLRWAAPADAPAGTPGPEASSNPLLARASADPHLPRVSLEFQSQGIGLDRPTVPSVWRMRQILGLVGSSPRCKIRLMDSNLSKIHCAMLRTVEGLWVVDLLGRGGVTLNGVPLQSGRLGPEDFLNLGQVVVRARLEDAGTPESDATPMLRVPTPPPPVWDSPSPPVSQLPAAASAELNALAAREPALGLLLNHFGQMQQQMVDQFQQSLMMMMQMFGGMHREQMNMARDQMSMVREEMDRIRDLNAEIAEIKTQLASRAQAAPPVPPLGPVHTPFSPNHAQRPPYPNSNGSQGGPKLAADNGPPVAPVLPPADPPSAEVHDWLNERLNSITEEQQNRWQRVMGMIRGGK